MPPGDSRGAGAAGAASRGRDIAGRLRGSAAIRVGGPWRRLRRRRERDAALARLRSDPDPTITAVGRALTAAVASPDPAERAWVERIEGLRAALGRSDEVLHGRRSDWTGKPEHGKVRETPVARLALEVSKPARWGRVLLSLTRELTPRQSIELGTCIGLSTAYQAAGLELRGGEGRVGTVEVSNARIELARANLERLGVAGRVDTRRGRFEETLDAVLAETGPIDFAFVDGHHKLRPTLAYFDRVARQMPARGVVLFDDITWSKGMRKAWARISRDRRVMLAVDLHGLGLCVVRGAAETGAVPHHVEVPLHP